MKRVLLSLSFGVVVFSLAGVTFAQLPPGGTFTDDNGNTHEGYIEAIAAAGITSGCKPSFYCPADDVTRGQMASFLARALDLPASARDYFPDDTGLVHEENINRIAAAGITTGFGDGTYRPAELVRRDQMASFLARALELPPTGQDYFSDDTGLVHEDNINRIAAAGVTQGCGTGIYCPSENVRRDQMASFLGRALGLDPIVPPPPVGTLYSGPLAPQPGFAGTITFEVSEDGDEVRNPMVGLVLDSYQCDGVTLSGDGVSTIFTTVPVINGSFSYSSSMLNWTGTFDSATTASGTIGGNTLLGTPCEWGPVTWSAIDTGLSPSTTTTPTTTSSTSSTTTSSTTTTTLPSGGWPECDFTPFSISGTGYAMRELAVPGDDPAILEIDYAGAELFFVTTFDSHGGILDFPANDEGGGYAGVRPVNHAPSYGPMHEIEIDTASGAWTVEVKPICSARSMTGTTISGAGDEVVLIDRHGIATLTHDGVHNFIVWSHQGYSQSDLEVNEIGSFGGQVEIDEGTVFLDISTGLAPGQWTVTFP